MAYRNTIVFPDNLAARIESARASMQTAAGLPVSFGDAVRALIDDGIPVRRARGWLPGAPDAATSAAVRPDPATTTAHNRNAARDERVAAERARRRALGCECVANHKRACPLRGEHAPAGEGEAAS